MLKVRLQRIGKKGRAYFRVVVTEHTRKPKGKYLEDLGSYDPHKNEISVDAERVKYWFGHGAQASPTVNNLLVDRGVIEGKKVRAWKPRPQKHAMGSETQKKTESSTETLPVETNEVLTTEIRPEPTESTQEEVKPVEEKKEEIAEEQKTDGSTPIVNLN